MSDNRVAAVFSLLLAVVFWFIITLTQMPTAEREITLPVTPNIKDTLPERMGYRIFSENDTGSTTVTVKVNGPRYLIRENNLRPEDFTVTVNMSRVDAPGEYDLDVKVALKASVSEEVKMEGYVIDGIIGTAPPTIKLYFDEEKENDFVLYPEVIASGEGMVPEGFIYESFILSVDSVTLRGPALEINKIDKIMARLVLDAPIRISTTGDAELIPLSKDAVPVALKYTEIILPEGALSPTITVPVKIVKELPVSLDFKNVPAAYAGNLSELLNISYDPPRVRAAIDPVSFAAYEEGIYNTLSIGTKDFSSLTDREISFKIFISDINATILDDISEIKVAVDTSELGGKKIGIRDIRSIDLSADTNFTFKNVPEGSSPVLETKSINNIFICGPAETVNDIDVSQITASVDLADASLNLKPGENLIPVRFSIKNNNDCWVSGTYNVSIII